jgi:hypothetical protein
LSKAISNIKGTIEEMDLESEIDNGLSGKILPATPDVRNFSYTTVDNEVYYRENSIMKPVDVSDTIKERIKGMSAIRDCTLELIDMQLNEYSDEEIATKQKELNTLYDDFSKKFGLINGQTNKRAFNQDSSYCLLCSLEKTDDEGNFKGKADMFTKRTIKRAGRMEHQGQERRLRKHACKHDIRHSEGKRLQDTGGFIKPKGHEDLRHNRGGRKREACIKQG